MMRLTVMLLLLSLLGACSYLDRVIPDRRTEYQAARSMPDLEVPPDLTAENPNNDMDVPGQQGASLSRYQHSRSAGNGGAGAAASAAASAAAAPVQSGGGAGKALGSQQWVSVSGSTAQVWPKVASWFKDQGMKLVLNDAGLGVMETDWGQPMTQNGTTYRDKYQIVSQSGADAGTTVLFITDIRQEQVGKPGGGTEWIKQGESSAAEKALAGRLNVFLNGSNATAGPGSVPAPGPATSSSGTAAQAKRAEMQDAGDNRQELNLPDDYRTAWENTRTVLERVGLPVTHTDDQKGLYYISYHDRDKPQDGGLLSKLEFWKSDKQEGVPYVLSLKDDGGHTRLVVLDVKGDWIGNDDTSHILTLIQSEYNRL